MRRVVVLGVVVITAALAPLAGPAAADHPRPEPGMDYVTVAPQAKTRRGGLAKVIYLNRCAQGCPINITTDDASIDASTIPDQGGTITPFMFDDAAWDSVVACVTHDYAPYDIQVVTDRPAGNGYVEVMVAGRPNDVGMAANILGIAPLAGDCSTLTNVIAFDFANAHPGGNLVEICATAAHEAGHTFGLDHAFDCKDPMTYLNACGGKEFVNLELPCGEFDGERECKCGHTQDSYKKLISELGPGTFPGAPGATIEAPAEGATVPANATVFVQTEETRVVIRVELWINGWRWTDITGTHEQTLFSAPLPANLPDGVLDIEARVYNDVGAMGTDQVRVTKGVACTSAATCAAGQDCDGEGRCVYPPRPLHLGDTCTTDLDCDTTRCLSDGTNHVCASDCLTDVTACPDGFTCVETESPTSGACWPNDLLPSGGGCCSAGGENPVAPVSLVLVVILVGARARARARG